MLLVFSTAGHADDAAPEPGPAAGAMQGPRHIPNSFLAIKTHWNTELAIEALDDLGITAVHVDFNHNELEPTRGEYDFSDENRVIRSADLGARHGLDQTAIVTHPSEWLRVPGSAAMFPNDDGVEAFEEFMYRVAVRYKGRIRYWQAGGEPHMPTWQGRYVTMLKAFWRGVKRADPDNKVVLAGFSGGNYRHRSAEPEFLDIIYRHGGKDYFDIVASHPYCWPLMPEEGRMLETIGNMRKVMEKNGDAKPLWITEIGWAGVEPSMLGHLQQDFWHRHRSVSEEDQARALARVYLVAATVPWIERVYTFHLSGIPDAGYAEILSNPDFYMALWTPWLGDRVRPKEAYFAVKTVVAMIGESTYAERIDLGPDVWALVFQRDTEAVVALWTTGEDQVLTLGDTSMVTGVTSMVGTPVLISDSEIPEAELKNQDGETIVREDWSIDWDGPNTLSISGRPIYVKTDLGNVDRLKTQIQTAAARPKRDFPNG
ncbi:MAG TPA: hypothetical protein QGH10_01135 [Armatimonadota bacterium]|nr:hypothetical protein [Armatimonadota bacterium]